MSLLNLPIANHSCSIDPNTPPWLRRILSKCSSLKQVRAAVAEFDSELEKVIKFKQENPMMNGDSDGSDLGDAEEDEEETVMFPNVPVAGAHVKKFVEFNGWYDGKVLSYFETAKIINVELSNGTGTFVFAFNVALRCTNNLPNHLTSSRGTMDS